MDSEGIGTRHRVIRLKHEAIEELDQLKIRRGQLKEASKLIAKKIEWLEGYLKDEKESS